MKTRAWKKAYLFLPNNGRDMMMTALIV